MSRVLFLVLSAALLVSPDRTAPCGPAAPVPVVTSCKPQAPITVRLIPAGSASAGPLELAFEITPLIDLVDLAWEFRLPPGVLLVEGEATGAGDPSRGVLTAGVVRVDLPADGLPRKVVLAARGRFATLDGQGLESAEPVEATAALQWGMPQPDAPTVTRVLPRGELEIAVILPSTHREGR